MRSTLLPSNSPKISYGIREIVSKGYAMEAAGLPVFWENIGDPIQKGVKLPDWIKDIISKKAQEDLSYAYCESKGLPKTRAFLANLTNQRGGIQIGADDITFFNGLGDAIARVYSQISQESRMLMPSPTYPAHSSAERSRIKKEPITYRLNPENNWMPDFDEMRETLIANSDVVGILLINPDNPTGTVYRREIVEGFVTLAREFDLFILVDEIYENLVYDGKMTRLSEVIGDVPGIAMKGISKEIPWPGSRCGWLEYYNRASDPAFNAFCEKLDQCKMSEVCSTTLPQAVIPEIMTHPEYPALLEKRCQNIAGRMARLKSIISDIPGVYLNNAGGAFYVIVFFNPDEFFLPNPDAVFSEQRLEFYQKWVKPEDKADMKFVYYMLAGYGICSVPLSGFNSSIPGFRITLLEETTERFTEMLEQLRASLLTLSGASIPVSTL